MRIKSLLKPIVSLAVTMSVVLSMGVALLAARTGVPNDSFNVGDTIQAGTEIYDPYKISYIVIIEENDGQWKEIDTIRLNGRSWVSDGNYLVISVYDRRDSYYDLYVTPVNESSDEPSLTPEQLRQLSVNEFVETLYERILGRTYDVTGRDYWVDQLMNHGATGADVVRGIIGSEEFNPGELTEEEIVLELYRDMYNRIPSEGEVANWTSAIKGGASSEAVLNYFLSSPEWADVCAFYRVNF